MINIKLNKKIYIYMFLTFLSYSGAGRYDIDWINYEQFALNKGKFEIGNENIKVYKKDGSLSGIINKMPNFDGMNDRGNRTMFSDPQLLSSVLHLKKGEDYSFLLRHLRKDVNLYKSYKHNTDWDKNSIINNFSEYYNPKYNFNIGRDFLISRLDKVVFDVPSYETIDDFSILNPGDLVARAGKGATTSIGPVRGRTLAYDESETDFAGGLNVIANVEGRRIRSDRSRDYNTTDENAIDMVLSEIPKTALDIGTNNGDSG